MVHCSKPATCMHNRNCIPKWLPIAIGLCNAELIIAFVSRQIDAPAFSQKQLQIWNQKGRHPWAMASHSLAPEMVNRSTGRAWEVGPPNSTRQN